MPRDKDAFLKVTVLDFETLNETTRLDISLESEGFSARELMIIASCIADEAKEQMAKELEFDGRHLKGLSDLLKSFGDYLAQKAKEEEESAAAAETPTPSSSSTPAS